MGQVFLVQHPRLPRRDALKLLDAGVSRNDDFKARFQREADLLAQLSHPNVVTLHDRGEFEGRLWITMEYVDGTDGAELLKPSGHLEPELALSLVAGAGAALDYAWRKQRITHRDVKPANILVGIDEAETGSQIESVKLADFGIAKAAGEATSLTSTGMTIGTMQYISPEAIEGEQVDNRSDIYSLGCTAFHLLSGRPPFTGTSIASTMSAHLTKPVPSISTVNPRLAQAMDTVFERVLAKNPDDRYPSCAEFVTALQKASGSELRYSIPAQTLSAATLPKSSAVDPHAPTQVRKNEAAKIPQRRPVPLLFVAAVVAVVLVVVGVTGAYMAMRDGRIASTDPVPSTTTSTVPSVPRTTAVQAPTAEPIPTTSAPPATTTPRPVVTTTAEPTTAAASSIYAGMPCDTPGAESPDGRFGCSGLNRIWVDNNAPPLPTMSWDLIDQPCTSPGAKGRLEGSDGVLTCTLTAAGTYTWKTGPY